jgi:hypothetical protein
LAAYNQRNKVLRGLGFASYEEYLASPLWAEISRRKLDSEGRRCFACGKSATQVHHGDYDYYTLAGPDPRFWEAYFVLAELYAVCKADHEWAEYYLGSKLPPLVAAAQEQAEEEPAGRASTPRRPPRPAGVAGAGDERGTGATFGKGRR